MDQNETSNSDFITDSLLSFSYFPNFYNEWWPNKIFTSKSPFDWWNNISMLNIQPRSFLSNCPACVWFREHIHNRAQGSNPKTAIVKLQSYYCYTIHYVFFDLNSLNGTWDILLWVCIGNFWHLQYLLNHQTKTLFTLCRYETNTP